MRWLLAALALLGQLALVHASAAAVTFPTTCHDPARGLTIGVPEGWWTHPADASRRIGPCQRFGPEPFQLIPDDHGVLRGEAISVSWIIDSCVGFVEPPKSIEALEVAGRPARRIEVVPSDSPASPEYAQTFYWVQLSVEECARDSSFLDISTSAVAGQYARNVKVLDQMVNTISLSTPDSAMVEPQPANRAILIGLILLGLAGLSIALRYSQPWRRK